MRLPFLPLFLRGRLALASAAAGLFPRLQGLWRWAVGLVVLVLSCWTLVAAPAWAGLNDDRFDGDIFALYAGNGSLVPPRVTLADALQRSRPALMVLYADDSSDCKQFSTVVSQVQAFYGRVIEILPIRADGIPPQSSYAVTDPGHYLTGVVPQVVLFDAQGKVVLNSAGAVPYEKIDDKLRELFDLLPRSQSVELKRRQLNELTTELRN
jgi:hypothetical protein